jgi:hypothetical protein
MAYDSRANYIASETFDKASRMNGLSIAWGWFELLGYRQAVVIALLVDVYIRHRQHFDMADGDDELPKLNGKFRAGCVGMRPAVFFDQVEELCALGYLVVDDDGFFYITPELQKDTEKHVRRTAAKLFDDGKA